MKRILLTILAIVLVLGVVTAAGFSGYRFGYAQGIRATAGGQAPSLRPFDERGPDRMPGFGMQRDFHRGFGMGGFPMMGFRFWSPLLFLGQIAVLALIVWFVSWLFTRSGWRLTRTAPTSVAPPPPADTEVKEENQAS